MLDERPAEFLIFEVGDCRYGIAVEDIHELFHAPTIVPLPRAPVVVEGIINVRGKVVPVLDIRKRFGLADKSPEPSDHMILAQAASRTIALRVDNALRIVRISPADIEDARTIAVTADFVAGVAKLPDGVLIIYDLATFLSESETAGFAKAVAEAEA